MSPLYVGRYYNICVSIIDRRGSSSFKLFKVIQGRIQSMEEERYLSQLWQFYSTDTGFRIIKYIVPTQLLYNYF